MLRKVLVHALRNIARILLCASILLCFAVAFSEKGDIVDRNSDWIVLSFPLSLGLLVGSLYIPDKLPKSVYMKKSVDELLKEIRKPQRTN